MNVSSLNWRRGVVALLSLGAFVFFASQTVAAPDAESAPESDSPTIDTPGQVPADTWWEDDANGNIWNINSKNVGIGDSSPAAKFVVGDGDKFRVTVAGNVRTINGTVSAPAYSFVADNDTGIYLEKTQAPWLEFAVDSKEEMRVDASGVTVPDGNLGVGTAAGAKLHSMATTEQLRLGYNSLEYASFAVQNAGYLRLSATHPDGLVAELSDPNGPGLNWLVPSDVGMGMRVEGGITDSLIVSNTSTSFPGTDLMTITSAGKVGIGTTSPASLLSVGAGNLFQVTSTGQALTAKGSTTAPGFAFATDTDTGMWTWGGAPFNKFLDFSIDGVNAMSVTPTSWSAGGAGIINGEFHGKGYTFTEDFGSSGMYLNGDDVQLRSSGDICIGSC